MYCRKCPNKVKDNQEFCDKCGTKIEHFEISDITGKPDYSKMSDDEYIHQNPKLEKIVNWSDKNKKKLYGFIILSIILSAFFFLY